jgi:hypothetical protein
VTVSADDVTVTAQPTTKPAPAKSEPDGGPEVVVLPVEKPTPVGAAKASTPTTVAAPSTAPEQDASADVLHRLVPEGDAPVEPLDDPGDLRARLARTAALKKPGSKERQDQREGLQHRSSEQ